MHAGEGRAGIIKEEFSDAGVLERMTKHLDLSKPLFVHIQDPLTEDIPCYSFSLCF